MTGSRKRRAAERLTDPNDRFPLGPKAEWASAEELQSGDEVLQLKYIYTVRAAEPSDRRELWTLVLSDPRDYREDFRVDPRMPAERRLLVEREALYRRVVGGRA